MGSRAATKSLKRFQLSINHEIQFASRSEVSKNNDQSISKALLARVKDADYVKAESLLYSQPVNEQDEFQRIRTLISRGQLSEAESHLQSWLTESQPEEIRAEARLELARILAARGEWLEVVKVSSLALDCPVLATVSRLTLLQVRANAWLELSDFSKTTFDLDQARGLLNLYPNAPSSFYLEALQTKLQVATGRHFESIQVLERFYSKFRKAGAINFDQILTLLRVEAHALRVSNLPFENAAFAGILLCQAMGDTLYEALGWAELVASCDRDISDYARSTSTPLFEKFERARKLAKSLETKPLKDSKASSPLPLERSIKRMYFAKRGLIVDLENKTAQFVSLTEQHRTLLECLIAGSQSADSFFTSAWNLTYQPQRHETTLKVALKRLRDQTGITVRLRGGQIEICENDWILA